MSERPVRIRVRDAAFGYRGREVISGVDLELSAGEFVGVLGPNGSGKSTLLRGILGLARTLHGTVERNGTTIGYVPQREALDPVYPLCAEEVCRMGAFGNLRGWRRLSREDRERAVACLERVGLAELRRHPFSELSGGQRQRVLIARALVCRPQVLLLDEPTTGVDRPSQDVVLEVLARERREQGIAALMVTHDWQHVSEVLTSALWVGDGHVRKLAKGRDPFGVAGPAVPVGGSTAETTDPGGE